MGKKDQSNVAQLDKARADSILEGVDPRLQKKKALRAALKTLLSVVSEDWKLHAIATAMADHYDVDPRVLVHGERVGSKRPVEDAVLSYRKGSRTDQVTKDIAKEFFLNRVVLGEFVDFVDALFSSLAGGPAVLIVKDTFTPHTDGSEGEPALVVEYTTDKGTDSFVAVDASASGYSILASLGAEARGVGRGLEGADAGFHILATRMVCAVAGRYGYTVFCSEIGYHEGDDGEYLAFGISLVKLTA